MCCILCAVRSCCLCTHATIKQTPTPAGIYEALELRDKDPTAYMGKGVSKVRFTHQSQVLCVLWLTLVVERGTGHQQHQQHHWASSGWQEPSKPGKCTGSS